MIAVDGGTDGDDRAERRRLARGHLQRIEAAPGNAQHADAAAAPGLLGEPGDRGDDVVLLAGQVFVFQHAVRVTAAAQIDAQRGVAVAGEVGMHALVVGTGGIPLAVGNALDDRGDGMGLGVGRPPHSCRESAAVGQRNEQCRFLDDRVREVTHFPGIGLASTRKHGASCRRNGAMHASPRR
nr:hypothetical protein [Chromohalobacter salexigens]